ncbi:OmpA family protein [Zhouia sp. PK063]|uniref:OmpA family protein n=1 Tax=Zhouia sp. PK063 TaxID=3373602 RepID=UPI0037988636
MRKIYYILLLLLCAKWGYAQDGFELKRAKQYFNNAYYVEAINYYNKVITTHKTPPVIKNLADAYYYINDYKNAEQWYRFLIKMYGTQLNEDYYFKYAQSLKAVGKTQEANTLLLTYYAHDAEKEKALEKEIDYLDNVSAIGERFDIQNLNINTENAEFGGTVLANEFVFTAAKKTDGDSKYKWNNKNYLDIYTLPLADIKTKAPKKYTPIAGEVNTPLHEADAIFTKDGQTMYFTRNNTVDGKRNTDKNKITQLQIYKASLVNGVWQHITKLSFNSDSFSNEHPALSPDENTLYFASDRPGGFGSFDIYKVAITNDSIYGTPENLGAKINTPHKEQFPFIDSYGDLYYSSNGLAGYGNLDVYVCRNINGTFLKPDNVGLPVNSGYDDFAFRFTNTSEGYFSSNRATGKGSDDIYSFTVKKALKIEPCQQSISGIITDVTTNTPLANAKVVLKNEHVTALDSIVTDSTGHFKFTVNCETSYVVTAAKEAYTSNQKTLYLLKERDKDNDASLTLQSLQAIAAAKAAQQEKVAAAQAAAKKQAAIAADNEKKAAQKAAEKAQKEALSVLASNDPNIVEERGKVMIKTQPLYFDYNMWYLRKESRRRLDIVLEIMNKYPNITLEIGTHTDMRGDDHYNMWLSQKRSESVMQYLIQQGIAKERLSAKGYGETQPLIPCYSAKACTEEQHEINRRCEFVILSTIPIDVNK